MAMKTGEDPPKSTDLDGWRKAITNNRLKEFRLEAIVAAFQDLGITDPQVQNALAKHLSDSIVRILRTKVGFNKPNQGEDIIFRVHGDIFAALMSPKSADGRNLRLAFGPRVEFRMKDAIAKEQRDRWTADDIALDKKTKKEKLNGRPVSETVQLEASTDVKEPDVETREIEEGGTDDTNESGNAFDDGLTETDEHIDVERILDRVSDPKKRLAFHLFMNDVPFKSKHKNVETIAKALNISERTAREWVKEVRRFLAETDEVTHLMKFKAGERS